jgi:hypothetical protein
MSISSLGFIALAALICLAIGVVFLRWPDRVRQHDDRMTRYVKNREEYVTVLRTWGFILILGSVMIILLSALIIFVNFYCSG